MSILEYLESQGIDPASSIVEVNGQVYRVGTDFSQIEYKEGDQVEAFRIVAGG
jgi:thiamine biosynthesis protein ThiS